MKNASLLVECESWRTEDPSCFVKVEQSVSFVFLFQATFNPIPPGLFEGRGGGSGGGGGGGGAESARGL